MPLPDLNMNVRFGSGADCQICVAAGGLCAVGEADRSGPDAGIPRHQRWSSHLCAS
jgi:hypothetical protein